VPTSPFEQQTAPTGGLPEDAALESLDGTLPPQTSPAETPQTPAGRTDAEWKYFLDNMTAEQASAFAQFIRAEFPELSKLLDAPVETTSSEGSASQTPAISAPSGAFSPERLRNAQTLLKRYGPTEGLRRLRNQDPALAKQVARSLTHSKRAIEEQDSPPSED